MTLRGMDKVLMKAYANHLSSVHARVISRMSEVSLLQPVMGVHEYSMLIVFTCHETYSTLVEKA